MSTKIFPFRRLNPNKGRVDIPNAPLRQQVMTEEDRAIMRGLMKEAEALALNRRMKALPPKSLSIVMPPPIWFYTPEYITAFKSLAREARKILARKPEYKYMKEVIVWLDAYQIGTESYCASCGFEITAYEKDLVPYEIIVVDRQPILIEGLCGHCTQFPLENKTAKIIINLNLNLP